jgi:hypothetical protein
MTLRRMPVSVNLEVAMNNNQESVEVIDIQQQANDLLVEAMKQPGVAVMMELMEASEKYSRPITEYSSYFDYQRLPFHTSCNSPELV